MPGLHVPTLFFWQVGVSFLARSHTFHCYSLGDSAKMQNLWASLNVRVAPCHPWHRDISPSLDKSVEFLNASSPALIDAIPLSVLSKLRNFLWLGSFEVWNDNRRTCGAVCVLDPNMLCLLFKSTFPNDGKVLSCAFVLKCRGTMYRAQHVSPTRKIPPSP